MRRVEHHRIAGARHDRQRRGSRSPACCSRSWRRARTAGCCGCRWRRSSPRRCAMSQGARNWPFFTLIGLPVAPAASSRSVWRQRKAGICSTSTASAAGAHWSASCTSVSTGRPVRGAHLGQDRQALGHADAARGAERWCGWPCRSWICRSPARRSSRDSSARAAATSSAWARDLDLARAGDQHERQVVADGDVADVDDAWGGHLGSPRRLDGHGRGGRGAPARAVWRDRARSRRSAAAVKPRIVRPGSHRADLRARYLSHGAGEVKKPPRVLTRPARETPRVPRHS